MRPFNLLVKLVVDQCLIYRAADLVHIIHSYSVLSQATGRASACVSEGTKKKKGSSCKTWITRLYKQYLFWSHQMPNFQTVWSNANKPFFPQGLFPRSLHLTSVCAYFFFWITVMNVCVFVSKLINKWMQDALCGFCSCLIQVTQS